MTSKEKANELFKKYLNEMPKYLQGKLGREKAKQCALICVEEMLKMDLKLFDIIELQEVKQELNNYV